MTYRRTLDLFSEGEFYSRALTDEVQEIVLESGVDSGICVVTTQHTTSGILLLEHEVGILLDLKELAAYLSPPKQKFFHHDRGVDQNGRAHVLNALFNSTLTVAIEGKRLLLGEFQDLMFIDFQGIPKPRNVDVFIYGEKDE